MFGRKRKKRGDGTGIGAADVAAVEGGCCLIELIAGVFSCIAIVALVPLLIA